jgi:hypothetical protein
MIYLAGEVIDGDSFERRIIADDEDHTKEIAELLGYVYVGMLVLEFEDFNLN